MSKKRRKNKNNNIIMDRKEYLNERSALIEQDLKICKLLGTILFMFSGGSLMVSISNVKNLFTNPILYKNCLIASWIIYGITILLLLICFFASHKNLVRKLEILDNDYNNSGGLNNNCLNKLSGNCQFDHNKYIKIVNWFGFISIITCVIATFLLTYFIIQNF